jgi:hypothetical protein
MISGSHKPKDPCDLDIVTESINSKMKKLNLRTKTLNLSLCQSKTDKVIIQSTYIQFIVFYLYNKNENENFNITSTNKIFLNLK